MWLVSQQIPKPGIRFALDTPTAVPLNSRESYVKGWFVPDDGSSYELWLVAGESRFPAFTGLPRPDVLRHHKDNPVFENPGFVVRFERPPSEATAKLIALLKTREFVLARGISVPGFEEETSTPKELDLTYRPLVSILLPIPDAHPYLITCCVESVLRQQYRHWELCIPYDSSGPSNAGAYLEKLAAWDNRVKLIGKTGEFPELWDEALWMAEGNYVLRLDYRDELHPFALFEIVGALNGSESADLLYTDEDEMDFYGSRGRPVVKPDFDMEAFLSWNFIGNITAMRRTLLLQAGGYKFGQDGFDDWDVIFRMSEVNGSLRVRHIPKPLYHFRKGDDLTAPLPRDVTHGSAKVIANHLAKTGTRATVEPGLFPGSFRVRRSNGSDCQIAVFVRSEDGAFQHAALAANVDYRTTQVYELLGSGADLLSETDDQIAQHTARSLSEIVADVFIFINRPLDTVSHYFFEELAAQAMREDCCLVTGISLDRNGRILHSGLRRGSANEVVDEFAGIRFSKDEQLKYLNVVRWVDSISDEFFAVKRAQLIAIRGFETISSARMPQVVEELLNVAHSENTRVLVTPYAIATFDVAAVRAAPSSASACYEKPMEPEEPIRTDREPSSAGNEVVLQIDELQKELHAAQVERKLAASQLREMATERNRLLRELAVLEEITRSQIQELTAALELERRFTSRIRNSFLWKLSSPLRAGVRFMRRRL